MMSMMSVLLPHESITSCFTSSVISRAMHVLPILLLTASSSWFAPAGFASASDHEGSGSEVLQEPLTLSRDDEEESSIADHDVVGYESTVSEVSAPLDSDIIDEEGNSDVKEEEEYKPMGLQIWPDEDSFFHALEGGRLVLVIILAPWCNRGEEVGTNAALAAEWLDDTYLSLSSDSNFPLVSKPLIGIMESSSIDRFIGSIESFGPITHYPALKFVKMLTFPTTQREEDDDVGDNDGEVQLWDFLGPKETAKDLYDSVLMYWYKYVVSNAITSRSSEFTSDGNEGLLPPIFTFSSQLQLTTFLESHGDLLLRPAQARRRHGSKVEEEVFNFYMGQSELGGVFHPFEILEDDASHQCNESMEFMQEIDPYILLVQCRSKMEYGNIELTGDGKMAAKLMARLERHRKAKSDFDDLAEEMSHRRDAAFFALNATTHNEDTVDPGTKEVCDGLFDGIEGHVNGAVVYLRARRYVTYSLLDEKEDDDLHDNHSHNIWNQHRRRVIRNVRTDWDEVKEVPPHAIFVPSAKKFSEQQKAIHGKGAVKDPATPVEYVQSNLVASTIVHATPTVIWFDRDRMSQLAFPWYRKIHAVLFVDMALAYKVWRPNNSPHPPNSMNEPPWPSSLNHSSETIQLLLNQQRAIQMFYDAALRHRVGRPADDVVFLIVPSSEVRIMSTFGVDIWTPLDEALFGTTDDADDDQSNGDGKGFDESASADNGYCASSDTGENQNILPVVMITDSSGRSGMQSSRYYLCSKDIFTSSRSMEDFFEQFFNGTIGKPFIRSETQPPAPRATSSQTADQHRPNVTVLTGNTFESLVMDRDDEHTMLLMTSHSCGHCSRFSIFWNELSSLVQAMNWSSVINVMKIDVTKNDVPHSKINAWDTPTVYYFPAGEKNDPIEMTPVKKENSNPQHDYDEGLSWVTSGYDLVKWMVNQEKLDLELLSRLDSSTENDVAVDKQEIREK
ncbi:hypothetical protein ACHAXR_012908 [Thalassiosira sp. AJA248-18]